MSLEFRPTVYLVLKDNKEVAVIGNKGDISILNSSLTLEELEELIQKAKSFRQENQDSNIYVFERDWWDEARA